MISNGGLKFLRSEIGLKEKLDEIIKILEISVYLVEELQREEFLNVIAAQLRILLCENNVLSYNDNFSMHPIKRDMLQIEDINITSANDLFDTTKDEITLSEWRNQIIARDLDGNEISIVRVIKAYANKNGGAHVDRQVPDRDLFAITVLAKSYLINIAKYVIKKLEYDYITDIHSNLLAPIIKKVQ